MHKGRDYSKGLDAGDLSFYSLAAVVRLDRAITPNQTAFPVAPQLEDGQEVGDVFGGNPASSIGSPSRHCYSGELQRPQPVATPRQGARWRLGVSQGNTVQDTVSVTLKRPAEDGWEREAARRLGCYASSGSDGRRPGGRARTRPRRPAPALRGSRQVLRRLAGEGPDIARVGFAG